MILVYTLPVYHGKYFTERANVWAKATSAVQGDRGYTKRVPQWTNIQSNVILSNIFHYNIHLHLVQKTPVACTIV